MAGDVDDAHRELRGHAVEVFARRVAAFREQRVVVAHADHPFAGLLAGGLLAQAIHELVEVVHRPDRGCIEVRRAGVDAGAGIVAVRVDEARQQRVAVELDHARAGAGPALHLDLAADRADAVALDAERFDDAILRVEREDRAAAIDRLARRRPAARGDHPCARHGDRASEAHRRAW